MRLLLLVLFSVSFQVVNAEEFNAKVIAVMDGDTVMVLRGSQKIKIRLVNIDAPEMAQHFGKESHQALLNRLLQKQVQVNSRAVDSYGRMVAEISVDGRSVNEEQVRSGMAWEYSHFHSNKHYQALQNEARLARRGLWALADIPQSPEQWRKQHPSDDNKAVQKNMLTAAGVAPAKPDAGCGKKRHCSQMKTCEEAFFYLKQCGVKALDGNADGVPCEEMCASDRYRLRQGILD